MHACIHIYIYTYTYIHKISTLNYCKWSEYEGDTSNERCIPSGTPGVFLCSFACLRTGLSQVQTLTTWNLAIGRRSKPQLQVNHPGWLMVKHVTPHWFHGDYCHPILASPSLIEGSHNGEACRVEAVSDGRENCVWTLVCAMKTVNPSGQSRDSKRHGP